MKPVALVLSLSLLCLLSLPATPARATTFQMVSDSTLTDQARAVVDARVVDVEPSTLGDRPATDYIIEVDRVLKGDVPGSTLVVRVPGGAGPSGVGLKIWGAPEMAEGERALLFLAPRNDGTFRILQLMLGAFHRQTVAGRQLALRDLSEAQEVRPDGVGPAQDEVRDFDRFADWIADRAVGVLRDRDYLVAGSAGQPRSALEAFSLIKGDDDNAIRWFDFDEGKSIVWRVNASGQPGLGPDATAAAFNVALQAWDDDAGTNIRYTYTGTTSASTGFRDSDNVNAILFEDPGDDASAGSFDCGSGGVIAVGGPWFDDSTRAYKGKAYHQAVEADIVTNDGTSCFFDNNPKAAEEVFAHELGHTLGLGHSSIRDALMSARAHNDGRGARLTADDRAGIAELYTPGSGSGGGGNGGGGSQLTAPTGLTAVANAPRRVILTWSDQSTGETGFRIERSVAGGVFQVIATVPANTASYAVRGLTPNTSYRFRIRAVGANHAHSSYTPVASVRTPPAP